MGVKRFGDFGWCGGRTISGEMGKLRPIGGCKELGMVHKCKQRTFWRGGAGWMGRIEERRVPVQNAQVRQSIRKSVKKSMGTRSPRVCAPFGYDATRGDGKSGWNEEFVPGGGGANSERSKWNFEAGFPRYLSRRHIEATYRYS